MKIGDLVRHKYDGGVGIITGHIMKYSNVAMGLTKWFVVIWVVTIDNTPAQATFMPAFLELLDSTVKN